jgi:hypothetical protein
VACGDLKFEEAATSPNEPQPGSTTGNGLVTASIGGVPFSGRLGAAATANRRNVTAGSFDVNISR